VTEAVEKAQKEWIEGMLEPKGEEKSPHQEGKQEGPPKQEGDAGPPLQKFTCRECGREFDSWNALMGHVKVHSEKKEPAKKKEEPEKKEAEKKEEAERKKIEIPEPPSDQVSIMEEVLNRFSGRNLEVAREPVIELARLKGGMDPMELYSYLVQFGVVDKTARAVASSRTSSRCSCPAWPRSPRPRPSPSGRARGGSRGPSRCRPPGLKGTGGSRGRFRRRHPRPSQSARTRR